MSTTTLKGQWLCLNARCRDRGRVVVSRADVALPCRRCGRPMWNSSIATSVRYHGWYVSSRQSPVDEQWWAVVRDPAGKLRQIVMAPDAIRVGAAARVVINDLHVERQAS